MICGCGQTCSNWTGTFIFLQVVCNTYIIDVNRVVNMNLADDSTGYVTSYCFVIVLFTVF